MQESDVFVDKYIESVERQDSKVAASWVTAFQVLGSCKIGQYIHNYMGMKVESIGYSSMNTFT